MGARSTKEEAELLQRRIWMYRCRGMSLQKIADAVGKSKSTVAYHLQKARTNAYEWYEGVGEQEVVGEMILNHRELRQEALRNMARTEPGSASRLRWMQEARQQLRAETSFLFDLGLMRKAPEQLDIKMSDVRNMSADEIGRSIARLQKELAYTPVQGINMNRGGDAILEVEDEEDEEDYIDVTPTNVNGNRRSRRRTADPEALAILPPAPTPQPQAEPAEIPEDIPMPEGEDGEEDWEEFDPYSPSTSATTEDGP